MSDASEFAVWRYNHLEDRVKTLEAEVVNARVLAERVDNMAEAFKAIRNALYTAAGGFVLLFAGVMTQVIQ